MPRPVHTPPTVQLDEVTNGYVPEMTQGVNTDYILHLYCRYWLNKHATEIKKKMWEDLSKAEVFKLQVLELQFL